MGSTSKASRGGGDPAGSASGRSQARVGSSEASRGGGLGSPGVAADPVGGRPSLPPGTVTGVATAAHRDHEWNQGHNSARDCLRVLPGWAPTGGTPGLPADRWTGIPGPQCLFSSPSPQRGPGAHHRREIATDDAARGAFQTWDPPPHSGGGNAVERRGTSRTAGAPRAGPHDGLSISPRLFISHDSFGLAAFVAMAHGRGRPAGPRDLSLQCCARSTSMLECRRTSDLIS